MLRLGPQRNLTRHQTNLHWSRSRWIRPDRLHCCCGHHGIVIFGHNLVLNIASIDRPPVQQWCATASDSVQKSVLAWINQRLTRITRGAMWQSVNRYCFRSWIIKKWCPILISRYRTLMCRENQICSSESWHRAKKYDGKQWNHNWPLPVTRHFHFSDFQIFIMLGGIVLTTTSSVRGVSSRVTKRITLKMSYLTGKNRFFFNELLKSKYLCQCNLYKSPNITGQFNSWTGYFRQPNFWGSGISNKPGLKKRLALGYLRTSGTSSAPVTKFPDTTWNRSDD